MDIISIQPKSLAEAAMYGNVHAVQRLLNQGHSPDDTTEDGIPAIVHAVRSGEPEIVRLLCAADVDCDVQLSTDGTSALMCAAAKGYKEIITTLLHYQADTAITDHHNNSVMHYAALNGDYDSFELIAKHHHKELKLNEAGMNALHIACSEGHTGIAGLLLHQFNTKDIPGSDHKTAIHYASKSGSVLMVKMLIESRADLLVLDNYTMAAIHYACYSQHTGVASELIRADNRCLHLKDGWGNTPLHYAKHLADQDTVEMLLQQGADPHISNNDGVSPSELS